MAIKKIRPRPQIRTTEKRNHRPKNVADLKKKYKHLPLHFLFGIQKEIDHQCPFLDEYLEQLREVKTALEKIRSCPSLEQAKIQAAVGLHFIERIPEELDEVTRGNFEKLRQTGKDWKALAIEALNESKDPEKFVKI